MRPIPVEVRRRIVEDVEAGMSQRAAAKKWRVCPATASKILRMHTAGDDLQPKRPTGGPKRKIAHRQAEVEAFLKENKNATLEDIREFLEANVCLTTIWKQLKKWKLAHKKNDARRRADASGCGRKTSTVGNLEG